MVEEFIVTLCREIGLPPIEKGDDNRYRLKINERDEIEVEVSETGPSLHASFGTLPEEDREVVVMHLMKANYLGQGTGGAVIGLSSDEKSLTLSLALPYEVTYKAFKEQVEEFVNYLNYWREHIEHGGIPHSN